MKNLLFIPTFCGGISHQIPLFVLYYKYFRNNPHFKTAFLLPSKEHQMFIKQGVNVLPIDYFEQVTTDVADMQAQIFRLLAKEENAIEMFRPDVIIEDSSTITYMTCLKFGIPRISMHRTGFFRSIPAELRNPRHVHSLEKGKSINLPEHLIFTTPKETNLSTSQLEMIATAREMILNSKSKLVPGVLSIEVLPATIVNRESYFYTGPLNLQDNSSKALLAELDSFFSTNSNNKKVFISMGLIEQQPIAPVIRLLLRKGYCVISTIQLGDVQDDKSRFFYNPFLPLDYVCSKVDLVIHHCGSGIYHYPIMHLKPTITIGTQCYDREDVALRLEQLEVSRHTPSPGDDARYLEIFEMCLDEFERGQLSNIDVLGNLRDEILDTMSTFNAESAINFALNSATVDHI